MGKRRTPLVQADNPKLGDELRHRIARSELDLHGKTVPQAERAVSSFLQRMARRHPADVVRVITGRGAHSENAPVLGPAVERRLGELSQFVAEWQRAIDGGSYLVRLHDTRRQST